MMITDSTDSLPLANTPEVFGLHPNAEINYYSQATREIWNHLIELQPQTGELKFFHLPTFTLQICGKIFFVDHKLEKLFRHRPPRRRTREKCFN
jgi:hypothetical protein